MNRLNEWIALKMTLAVGTMWAFYTLVIYGLTPLFWPQYMDKILYWSNFIQLVFLPLLAVGTAVVEKRREKRDKDHREELERRDRETHDAVMKQLEEIKEMHTEVQTIVKNIHIHNQDATDEAMRKLTEHIAHNVRRNQFGR